MGDILHKFYKEFPNGYRKFLDWYVRHTVVENDFRKLYDFFDSKGIFLTLRRLDNDWGFVISYNNQSISSVDFSIPFKTRQEAEVEGFKYAFTLL